MYKRQGGFYKSPAIRFHRTSLPTEIARHLHAAPLPHPAYSAEKAWAARKGIGDMEGHWRHGRASQGIKHLLLYLLQLVFHLHHDILHLSLIAL